MRLPLIQSITQGEKRCFSKGSNEELPPCMIFKLFFLQLLLLLNTGCVMTKWTFTKNK